MTCNCLHEHELTRKKAAAHIGYKPDTLRKWAKKKEPDLKPFKRKGRKKILYYRSVLDAFLQDKQTP